jgi:hypothetical protein
MAIRDTSASGVNWSERAAHIPRIIARAHWTFGTNGEAAAIEGQLLLYFLYTLYNIMENGAYSICIAPMMDWSEIA